MTTQIEIPGLQVADVPGCTDPAELRRRADSNRGEAALLRLRIMGLERDAGQCDHEAALWDVADAADAALEDLQQRTPGLEAAEEGTLTAEREAQDRVREDRKHVARRKGEVTRAENGANREVQDDAAARLQRSVQRVAEAEAELATARRKHQAAEAALEAHRTALREAGAACARANKAGMNPGVAPYRSPDRISFSRPEDMTAPEKLLLQVYAREAAGGTGGTPHHDEPRRNRVTTNGEFAAQDPNGFRMIRRGTQMVAVPPDWRGTAP